MTPTPSPDTHAVFALDPGGTSAVAAAYVDLKPTLKETLLSARRKKTMEVEGTWSEQGAIIGDLMARFLFAAQVESRLSLDRIHFVFEDFVLRMPAVTTNLTSIWVMASAATHHGLTKPEIEYQQPSEAKALATNARLKMWDLWVYGSEHERDANRHLVLKVNKLVD